jgi:hypothetical protein
MRTAAWSNELLKYRQAAKAFAELDLGDVDPLVLSSPSCRPSRRSSAGWRGFARRAQSRWGYQRGNHRKVIATRLPLVLWS